MSIDKSLIDRINYLSRKSRSEGLTEAEKEEQARVRQQYIDAIKARVKDTLDRVEFVDDPKQAYGETLPNGSCSCTGHSGKHHTH
ncbi:DUF896 domain-containing protein [Heliobacterium chlorum]|uniref:DUF896 domain-containing protein n=1 Tax=Heliobacterium chlorum TaxID=2698 RepID=UPI001FAC099E|nr:DUF896 domain-containing protein [Heliobacterium chlorum]